MKEASRVYLLSGAICVLSIFFLIIYNGENAVIVGTTTGILGGFIIAIITALINRYAILLSYKRRIFKLLGKSEQLVEMYTMSLYERKKYGLSKHELVKKSLEIYEFSTDVFAELYNFCDEYTSIFNNIKWTVGSI